MKALSIGYKSEGSYMKWVKPQITDEEDIKTVTQQGGGGKDDPGGGGGGGSGS